MKDSDKSEFRLELERKARESTGRSAHESASEWTANKQVEALALVAKSISGLAETVAYIAIFYPITGLIIWFIFH